MSDLRLTGPPGHLAEAKPITLLEVKIKVEGGDDLKDAELDKMTRTFKARVARWASSQARKVTVDYG